MAKRLFLYVVLFSLILVGAWIRMHGILNGSFSFTYDVGRDLLAAEDIVINKNLTLLGPITGLEGFFYGPWWYYLLALPFIFTGGDPKGIAFFFAFLGVANIILAFFVGRKIGGNFLGFVCASSISVSPFFIHTSSQIWNPNVVPTLVLLAIFCFWKILHQRVILKKTWAVLGILIALIAEMEIIFGLLFGVATILSLVLFLRKQMKKFQFALFGVGLLIIEAPRLLFEFRHEFLMSKKVLEVLGQTPKFSFISIFTKSNFIEIESAFGKLWSDAVAGEDHLIRMLLLIYLIFIVIISYQKASLFEKFFFQFTIATLAIFIAAFVLFPEGLWQHYLIGLPVLFVFATGITLNLLRRRFGFKLALILLVMILWINSNPIIFIISQNKPAWMGDEAVYRNQIAIIDYIYEEADGREFKYVLYTPPVHDYTYRYLFSWYGKKRYNSVPSGQNARLSFFIIEPDNVFWHRRNQWLEARRSDGKVIKEKRFGWVIVQTRVLN